VWSGSNASEGNHPHVGHRHELAQDSCSVRTEFHRKVSRKSLIGFTAHSARVRSGSPGPLHRHGRRPEIDATPQVDIRRGAAARWRRRELHNSATPQLRNQRPTPQLPRDNGT
jgi:hypothetical protein